MILPFPLSSVDNFHAVYMVVNMFIHRHKCVVSTEIAFSLFIVIVRFSNIKLIQILFHVLPEKKSSGSGTGSTQPREYN
jgi:hypothetical protein